MPIAFKLSGTISGVSGGSNVLSNPTSLQFGPDERLYVSEQNGSINAFAVEKQGDNWVSTSHEQLEDGSGNEIVKSIQNHNDEGSENSNGNRPTRGSATNAQDLVDLFCGLPRSEEDQAGNRMVPRGDGTTPALQVGGNTIRAAPSSFFSATDEPALIGTIHELDRVELDGLPGRIAPQRGPGNITPEFRAY